MVTAIALLLCLPSLWHGWQVDDYTHQVALVGHEKLPEIKRPPTDAFAFVSGKPEDHKRAVETGFLPWWSSPNLRLSFFRPVSSLTHWLDYQLWPNSPFMMHLQSLAWLGGVIALSISLFRRLIRPAWVAGLAILLFAIDDVHGLPATWIANRNALIALFFGLLALLAHHRLRHDGWKPGWILGPLALLLSVTANEGGSAMGGYLLAYAIFVDRESRTSRVMSLAPYLLVGIGWLITYKMLGHGATGSGMYVDPISEPLRYVRTAAERVPILLFGQWLLSANLYMIIATEFRGIYWLVAVTFALVMAWLMLPLLRRNAMARFWVAGMLLALVPPSATFVADRLLVFVGIGGMGLMAQWIADTGVIGNDDPMAGSRGRLARMLAWILIIGNVVMSPLSLMTKSYSVTMFGGVIERAMAGIPDDRALENQTLIVVNTPTFFVNLNIPIMQAVKGKAVAEQFFSLTAGESPLTLTRTDERTVHVHLEDGMFTWQSPEIISREGMDMIDPQYIGCRMDKLLRDDRPFRQGEIQNVRGIEIEVLIADESGRARAIEFRFQHPLEDQRYRWLKWDEAKFVPMVLPAVGERVSFPRIRLPLMKRVE
ncbi:MAG: hypothetical protein ACYTHJ_10000 [Planctomycetota bacterium]